MSRAIGGYMPRGTRRHVPSPPAGELLRSGRFTAIQYLAGDRWVNERLFADHLQMTGPACHIALVWDQVLSACPGRSWRMVLTGAGEPDFVMYGPTVAVPGGRWGPAPGREALCLTPPFIPLEKSP